MEMFLYFRINLISNWKEINNHRLLLTKSAKTMKSTLQLSLSIIVGWVMQLGVILPSSKFNKKHK